jgi:small subunit ribosomal protein S16
MQRPQSPQYLQYWGSLRPRLTTSITRLATGVITLGALIGRKPLRGFRHNARPTTERLLHMAVRMRLTRIGSKKNPIYRVVVADSRSPRDGRFIEIVGRYNPQTNPSTIELDEAKVKDWLAKGAQPSDPVARLIKAAGIEE